MPPRARRALPVFAFSALLLAAPAAAAESAPPDDPPPVAGTDPARVRRIEREVEALRVHAKVLLREERWREAEQTLEHARRLCVDAGIGGERLESLDALLARARARGEPEFTPPRTADEVTLKRLGRMSFAPALRELEAKFKKNPDDLDARWKLAAVQIFHGQWEKARALVAGETAPAPDEPDLFERLRKRLAARGDTLRVVLLDLAEGRLEEALRRLKTAKPTTPNDIVRAKLLAMDLARRFGEPARFRELARELAKEAGAPGAEIELEIAKLLCARRLWGFGRYERRPEPFTYRPGDSCVLYIEVENASAETLAAEKFETDFRVSVKIQDRAAPPRTVWSLPEAQARRDMLHSRPRDVSTHAKFNLPPDLAPGEYHFLVRVVDVKTERAAEAALPFTVAK